MNYKFINTEYIVTVSGGDNEIIRELVTMFSDQVLEIADEMRNLLKAGDYYNLGLVAHKAKSSVAIMGMADLAAILKNFELQAKAGESKEMYDSYINRYESDTAGAVKELDEYVKTL
jgi:HPt (histidine-containing phosphotransfer) domain-containing protein